MPQDFSKYLLASIAGLTFLAAAFGVRHMVIDAERDRIEAATIAAAARFEARLETQVAFHFGVVQIMRERWESGVISSANQFRDEALFAQQLFGDLLALNWIAPDGHVEAIVGAAGDDTAAYNEFSFGSDIEALARAGRTLKPQMAAPMALNAADTEIEIFVPMRQPDGEISYIDIVFLAKSILTNAIEGIATENFQIAVKDGETLIFGRFGPDGTEDYFVQSRYEFAGRDWSILVAPSDTYLAREASSLDEVVMAGGILIALIAATLTFVSLKQQASLRTSETRARAILNTVVDGIITIDDKGSILEFNPASEKLFGYSADEVLGQNISKLMPEADARHHDSHLARFNPVTPNQNVIGKGRDLIGVRKDGTTFVLELAVSITRDQGQRKFTGVLRDVTEERQVTIMKDAFISSVSHELRTPLTTISGALGVLEVKSKGSLDQKSQRLLDLSRDGCTRLGNLINDILDLEKIAAGKMDYHLEVAEISALVKDIVERHGSYADVHQVEFVLRLPDTPIYCRVDKSRFNQALVNLLSNAAKFSPPGGKVVFKVEAAEADNVCISVIDKGAGIPESFLPKVFEKFSQADNTSTRAKGGSGLGLSITKDIIEALGGKIDFHTELGKGTTFQIHLPTLADAPMERIAS